MRMLTGFACALALLVSSCALTPQNTPTVTRAERYANAPTYLVGVRGAT